MACEEKLHQADDEESEAVSEELQHCAICGREIEEDEEYEETDDGVICEDCFEEHYFKCEFCDEVTSEADKHVWDGCAICPNCWEEKMYPYGKPDEEETDAEYDDMVKKYLGRKTSLDKGKTTTLDTMSDDDGNVYYYLDVTVDEEGRITEIDPLRAEAETVTSERWSETEDYPIYEGDYEEYAIPMLEDYLEDDEKKDPDE